MRFRAAPATVAAERLGAETTASEAAILLLYFRAVVVEEIERFRGEAGRVGESKSTVESKDELSEAVVNGEAKNGSPSPGTPSNESCGTSKSIPFGSCFRGEP